MKGDRLMNMPEFADIDIVFDATSAGAHVKNDAALREAKPDIRLIDLTPAAIGPTACRSLISRRMSIN